MVWTTTTVLLQEVMLPRQSLVNDALMMQRTKGARRQAGEGGVLCARVRNARAQPPLENVSFQIPGQTRKDDSEKDPV